jgi:hypothetical protein
LNSTRDIDALIDMMARLPGLGPRSARRAVLHMIRKRAILLAPLADMMRQVAETARECTICGKGEQPGPGPAAGPGAGSEQHGQATAVRGKTQVIQPFHSLHG